MRRHLGVTAAGLAILLCLGASRAADDPELNPFGFSCDNQTTYSLADYL
ncbi:MAG: hypothetical protein HYU66_01190, partial [Armatimonadetes bacterium]|nr:hypothetical protein [Armatimonadota bacterium]